MWASHRMPIVLGTFTSSSTKFVDLSYYAQSCRDSMKALQPLVAKNARQSSLICCRWQTKQWMQHAYCFLLLALLFRKIANMRIFHSERSNPENTYTLLYFAGILFKGKLQKEIWNFPFILARARGARWVLHGRAKIAVFLSELCEHVVWQELDLLWFNGHFNPSLSSVFFSPFSVRRGLDLSPKSPNAFRDCVPTTISSGLFELVTKRLDTRSVFIKSVFIKTLRPLDPERRWTG